MNKTQQIMVFKMLFVYLDLILQYLIWDDTLTASAMSARVKEMFKQIEGN
jgi:hypothetical protein